MAEPKGKPPHAGERLTREDVLRLIEEHGGPEGLDLREAGPSELDLHGAYLAGANLQGANLRQANLREASLLGANLRGADLSKADLQGADLCEANLREAHLSGANLHDAELPEADLREAELHDADLGEADLPYANFQRAVLSGANLQAATLPSADLRDADLRGANLNETDFRDANLRNANLQGAYLCEANLREARLPDANLQGADLTLANLQGAKLPGAHLQGANLTLTDLRRAWLAYAELQAARLENAEWGDYVLGEEIGGEFLEGVAAYRALKQWHTEAGIYDVAGEFHYREMEARRKLAQFVLHRPSALALNALRFLYGYGERPERVIGWAAGVVFGLALVHWLFGTVAGGFLEALYYSAVSFPALGYGEWAPEPQGWAGRFLGAGESFIGVFMMALFLVTFTRKMTR